MRSATLFQRRVQEAQRLLVRGQFLAQTHGVAGGRNGVLQRVGSELSLAR